MASQPEITISGSEKRRMYLYQVMLYLLMGGAYLFTCTNYIYDSPLSVVFHNLIFGIIFTLCFLFRKRNFNLTILITGFCYQAFIFGHAYFLLPGKQIEAGLGILTAILPIFTNGIRLWVIFVINFMLYHLAVINADYENFFFAQYAFYIIIFVIIRVVLNENEKYEKALLVQRNKIERDAQSLREADELKTRFFANISHELRTPLTLLLSPIHSILASQKLSERNRTYLQLMEQNGQQLLKRINELLELSRLGSNKVEVHPTPVNLHEFSKQILSIYEGAASLKNIELNYNNTLEANTQLLLDVPKLEVILSNLLSNALKFTPENGRIQVHISRQKDHLQISVSDTGIGIPEQDLTRIFDRFHQVKNKTYHEGTGIGLALCKELAALQNGKIWAESKIEEGSTFYLHLPFLETSENPKTLQKIERLPYPNMQHFANANPKNANTETILVVEDNADLRHYLQLVLSEHYQVQIVENGQVAMEILTKNRIQNSLPALIITDLMMPVMDGATLLQNIKSEDSLRHIPVIVLTAQQSSEVKIETLRIGVDDYLTKPFIESELLARVHNLILNTQERLEQQSSSTSSKKTEKKQGNISKADLEWLQIVEKLLIAQIGNASFKLSELAQELHISQRRFQQKIKTITGQTPKKYQRSIQLHEARKILKSGNIKTVSELSYQLGFEDQHYFSKLYKQQFGLTPKEELARI